MTIIVQKYGGSSLATPAQVKQVAGLIRDRLQTGVQLCVVVSAMGKTTNELLGLAHEISKHPVRRELDMLLSCGERASMALLAMALDELGVPSMSLTGSQSGIITDEVHSGARIVEVRPTRVLDGLQQGKMVIIAGFQGVSRTKEITTLGRGGSDTTAVAMAAALDAEACEIYSDVDGVYSADPRIVKDAHHIDQLSHDEMLELAGSGAKVLNTQAVEYAKLKGIEIKARKTGDSTRETQILPSPLGRGTAGEGIRAITSQSKLYRFAFDTPDELLAIINALSIAGIKGYQIMGSPSGVCIIAPEDAHGVDKITSLRRLPDCASISIIGTGVGEDMNLLAQTLDYFKTAQISIFGLLVTRLRLYFLIEPGRVEQAVRDLHEGVNLK
jgi:aspartate kinase